MQALKSNVMFLISLLGGDAGGGGGQGMTASGGKISMLNLISSMCSSGMSEFGGV